MEIGIVCNACDWLNEMKAASCASCNTALKGSKKQAAASAEAAAPVAKPVDPPPVPPPAPIAAPVASPGAPPVAAPIAAPLAPPPIAAPVAASAAPVDSSSLCPQCQTPVTSSMRFCGSCGFRLDANGAAPQASAHASAHANAQSAASKTMFFGAMQAPNRAKLILIKGDGMDGVSYHLQSTDHIAGRTHGDIRFADDVLLSPKHAGFSYQQNTLMVRDEGSTNGVFVRIKGEVPLAAGTCFLVGEQLLRFEHLAQNTGQMTADSEGTYFYGSPHRPGYFRLLQVLRGGHVGMIFRAPAAEITLGRDGNDINFPDDPFISGRHALVRYSGDRYSLVDLSSKNGTFIRIEQPMPLYHGDYVFIGQQLLRVEIT